MEVRNRIERAIGPYEDLLTTVKRRKLKWYGHVSRSSGLSKTIMQGTVKGGRRRGGQRKRWEDNIKDWTCLRAAESLRVSKDRNGWRAVVRRSIISFADNTRVYTNITQIENSDSLQTDLNYINLWTIN